MAESNQPTPNIGANGFIWILLAAAGTFFVARQVPLEGSRPPITETFIPERTAVQDIDARLWQDPFAAVAETLTRSPELKPEICPKNGIKDQQDNETKDRRIEDHCQSPLNKFGAPYPLVLIASVSGAPYSEDREFRRRTRFAVLAGLDAEGFVPKDSQHIGFYWPDPAGVHQVQLPKVVPFEWFKPKSNGASLPDALLLWYDEDVLSDTPLKQFDEFLCRSLTTAAPGPLKAKILGPENSTTLQEMAIEAMAVGDGKHWSSGICAKSVRPQFYVYSATADDTTLIPKDDTLAPSSSCLTWDTCITEFFDKKGINLYRMIATDGALSLTIRNELSLRGVEVKQDRHSHIALVSEWDTLYGRSLPESMARCLGESGKCDHDIDPFAAKSWLHPFKYLRGLDGQMPNVDGLGSGNDSKDTRSKPDKDTKDSTKAGSDAKPQDRAEGQGQFDYLQRLGDRIRQRDADLRRSDPKGIEAVGILGSDLYDKLLVLQALRPLLPNALFFTTDLDARVVHPIALTSTRNLLIASSFGLQLRPALQGEIPPFRSSYQTAGFLATRVAVRDDNGPLPAWFTPPLLFEVGTSRVFQFASQGSPGKQPESEDQRPDRSDCETNVLACAEIHPLASAMFPRVSTPSAVVFSALGLCFAMSFYPLRRRIWDRIDAFMRGSRSYAALGARGVVIIIGLCVVVSALVAAICALWSPLADALTKDGQPMILLNGISVWPTIFLRAAILILCIYLIIHGYRCVNENIEKIARDLHLVETRRDVKTEQDDIVRNSPPWLGFASHFWYLLPAADEATYRNDARVPYDIFRFWRMYIYQGYWIARIYRVTAGAAAMVLLWLILYLVFGNPPVPARGSMSLWAYGSVTLVLVFATLFLIFFVADTTLLCWRVVKALRAETTIWPAKTLEEFSQRLGLPQSVLDDWIDLLFVSKRTRCITTLIYYPFLIIALLVVSRSRLFANYGPSIPDLIAMGGGVLVVTVCAVALRWSAEASRAKARRRLNDQIVAARKLKDGGRLAGQLERLLLRVEELRDGAFSPFSQQPVVRAMLLPLGSFGGTALLEYLLLPGLS
jgi:hypothetical protein